MAAVNHINEHAESAVQFIPADTRAAWADARRADVSLEQQIRAALDKTDPRRPWDREGRTFRDPGRAIEIESKAEALGHWLVPRLCALVGLLAVIAIVKGY